MSSRNFLISSLLPKILSRVILLRYLTCVLIEEISFLKTKKLVLQTISANNDKVPMDLLYFEETNPFRTTKFPVGIVYAKGNQVSQWTFDDFAIGDIVYVKGEKKAKVIDKREADGKILAKRVEGAMKSSNWVWPTTLTKSRM